MLFWPKTGAPENNSDRECCWQHVIGQHPLSLVFVQKRPGAPGSSYFAWLPSVLGHFILCSFPVGYSTTRTDQHGQQEQFYSKIDKMLSFFCKQFWGQPVKRLSVWEILRSFVTPARTTTMSTERCIDCRQSRQLMSVWTEGVIIAELCDGYNKMICTT